MFPLIIKCPNCNSLFKLNQKPSKTFSCPKCHIKVPFDEIIRGKDELVTQLEPTPVTADSKAIGEVTQVVNFGEKTMLVPGLQQPSGKTATLIISFKGINIGKAILPGNGNFNLGRRSSDSTAQIKLAPDMTMSRVHAAMRTVRGKEGNIDYQITTIKQENPVFVNGVMIGKGKICTLKSGDIIQMGKTVLTFKLD